MIEDEARISVVHVLLDQADEYLHNDFGSAGELTQTFRGITAALWRQAVIAAAELNEPVIYKFDSEMGEFEEGRNMRLKLALLRGTHVHKSRHPGVPGSVNVSLGRYSDPDNTTWWIVQLTSKNLHLLYESLSQRLADLCRGLFLNVAEDLGRRR